MDVRKLTDDEKAQIKIAKEAANKFIKAKRDAIRGEIKALKKWTFSKVSELKKFEDQLNDLNFITGQPVCVSISGNSVYLNYEILQKLDRSLAKKFWHRTLSIQPGVSLTITYSTGVVELYQIPLNHIEMLSGLPIIEMEGY